MPNYAQPFETLGSAAGGAAGGAAGAAGGGLLGRLGDLLSPLDYPRQALWNLARSAGNALTGQGSADDALRAIPGALGGALAGGLALTGFGAPAGILAGSLLGGAAQGVGKAVGGEKFDAPTVQDLTGSDNPLVNMLAGAATDPLTFAGGIGGAAKGAEAGGQLGRNFGRGLEEAALWRGPNYGGGLEKLDAALAGAPKKGSAEYLIDAIRGNPAALSELPEGSSYLAHGNQTMAFRTPTGHVVSMITPSDWNDAAAGTRLDIPEMLQAARSKLYEGEGMTPLRVEHTPMLDVPGKVRPGERVSERVARLAPVNEDLSQMANDMITRGVSFEDVHPGNVGYSPAGQPFILDPEAVQPTLTTGQAIPRAPDLAAREPSRLQSALLRLLGGDQSVRGELGQALQQYRGGSTVLPTLPQQQASGGQVSISDLLASMR